MAIIKYYELWSYLGWIDIIHRYRRSLIGPFWITLNNAVITIGLSAVWINIFHSTVENYLPAFAVSNIVWIYIATVISDSTSVIIGAENYLKQTNIPVNIFFMRMLWRNLIFFGHHLPIPIALFLLFPAAFKGGVTDVGFSVFGLVILTVFLYFFSLIVGLACVRYRDLTQVTNSMLQMIFLATPILWSVSVLGERTYIYKWNIFYHLVEIVRSPLLTGVVPIASLVIVTIASVLLGLIWNRLQKAYGRLIVYWI